jgi:hypothetical protein
LCPLPHEPWGPNRMEALTLVMRAPDHSIIVTAVVTVCRVRYAEEESAGDEGRRDEIIVESTKSSASESSSSS